MCVYMCVCLCTPKLTGKRMAYGAYAKVGAAGEERANAILLRMRRLEEVVVREEGDWRLSAGNVEMEARLLELFDQVRWWLQSTSIAASQLVPHRLMSAPSTFRA